MHMRETETERAKLHKLVKDIKLMDKCIDLYILLLIARFLWKQVHNGPKERKNLLRHGFYLL